MDAATEAVDFGPGLRRVRRRRWYLWGVIVGYLPAMWLSLRFLTLSQTISTVFVGWFVLLFVAALVAAVARCPRCGNYFHLNGMTLLYLRRCLHCQLHVNADRQQRKG